MSNQFPVGLAEIELQELVSAHISLTIQYKDGGVVCLSQKGEETHEVKETAADEAVVFTWQWWIGGWKEAAEREDSEEFASPV